MSDTNVRAFNWLKLLSNVGSVALALNAVRNNEPGASAAFWHSATDLSTWTVERLRSRHKQIIGSTTPELGESVGVVFQNNVNNFKNVLNNTFKNCNIKLSIYKFSTANGDLNEGVDGTKNVATIQVSFIYEKTTYFGYLDVSNEYDNPFEILFEKPKQSVAEQLKLFALLLNDRPVLLSNSKKSQGNIDVKYSGQDDGKIYSFTFNIKLNDPSKTVNICTLSVGETTSEVGAEEGLDSIINKLKKFFENTADCYPQVSKMYGGIELELSVMFGESGGFSFTESSSTFTSLQNAKNHQDIYNAIKAIMKNNGIDSTFSDGTLTLTVDTVNICSSDAGDY